MGELWLKSNFTSANLGSNLLRNTIYILFAYVYGKTKDMHFWKSLLNLLHFHHSVPLESVTNCFLAVKVHWGCMHVFVQNVSLIPTRMKIGTVKISDLT